MRLANLSKLIRTAIAKTISLLYTSPPRTSPRQSMPPTSRSLMSSLTRRKKAPSFLDDLAFVMFAAPEERRRIRERRQAESKASSSREGGKRSKTRDISRDREIVSESESVGRDRGHWRAGSERRTKGWREHRPTVVEGSSFDGSTESLSRPGDGRRTLSLTRGEEFLRRKEEYRRTGTITTADSSSGWQTAESSLSSRVSGTAGRSSGSRVDTPDTSMAMKRLSLAERGEKARDREVGQGSWRRDARHKREDSQSQRSSSSAAQKQEASSVSQRTSPPRKNKSSTLRRAFPPGGWPSSSVRSQETGSCRHASVPQDRKARGTESVPTVGTRERPALADEKDRKKPRGAPVPRVPIQHRNPNTIPPRRPKRCRAGNRHLRPGIPLTVTNLTHHTVSGGGEKSYQAKSSGWMGCTDSDDESEASLWDGGNYRELDLWDSVSNRDFKHYYLDEKKAGRRK